MFGSLFGRKNKSVIGIDIGSSSIKMVQAVKKKGVAVLETYGSLELGPYVGGKEVGQFVSADEGVLHTVVSLLLKEANITSRQGGISIPFHSSFISLIEVPALSDEKIAQMIPFEVRKHVPVPVEDISVDWFIVPSALLSDDEQPLFGSASDEEPPALSKRKILLIAIHNHELIKYKKVIDRAEITPSFFEIEIFSTLRSVVFENRFPIMIIDIGARTTKFYILEHGIVLRSYFINQGGQTITTAISSAVGVDFKEAERMKREKGFNSENQDQVKAIATSIDEIFAESDNAIKDFEHKYKKTLGKIIFTGGGANLKGLLDEAKKHTNIEVELADPFSRLRHPVFLSETLRQTGPEFAVAVGAALRMLGE